MLVLLAISGCLKSDADFKTSVKLLDELKTDVSAIKQTQEQLVSGQNNQTAGRDQNSTLALVAAIISVPVTLLIYTKVLRPLRLWNEKRCQAHSRT